MTCQTASILNSEFVVLLHNITQSPEHHKYFWKGTFQPSVVLWLKGIDFVNLDLSHEC